MTGKRYLCRRSKDSNLTRVPGFCRKDERAFGEVELARDLLHLMLRKTARLRQDGQWIPAKTRLRKYITDVVSIFHESGNQLRKIRERKQQISPLHQVYSCVRLRRDDLAYIVG